MKVSHGLLIVLILAPLFYSCASGVDSNIENASFQLDKNTPSSLANAIADGNAALKSDPTNPVAARIVASAYFSLGNFDFLTLAQAVVNLSPDDPAAYVDLANAMSAKGNLEDLHSAVLTLRSALPTNPSTVLTTDDEKNAAFDFGMMEVVEFYAQGVYGSDYKATFDPTFANFPSDDSYTVQGLDDLLDFDKRLVAAGTSTANNKFITRVRQDFCILTYLQGATQTPFIQLDYESFVGCSLESSAQGGTFTPLAGSNMANCAAVDPNTQNAAVQACYDLPTAL